MPDLPDSPEGVAELLELAQHLLDTCRLVRDVSKGKGLYREGLLAGVIAKAEESLWLD